MKSSLFRLAFLLFVVCTTILIAQSTRAQDKKASYWADELRKKNPKAIGALIDAGAEAIPAVHPILNDSEVTARKSAYRVLGSMGPHARSSVPQIAKGLAHADPMTRVAALECLGSLGFHAKETSASVADLLLHPVAEVRAQAWIALKESSTDEKILPLARKAVQDRTPESGANAIWLVWRLDPNVKGRDLFPALVAMCDTKQGRDPAIGVIQAIGPDYPEMAFEVAKLFKIKNSSLRQQVITTLPFMGKEGLAAVRPLIEEALGSDKDANLQMAALEVLSQHGLDDDLLVKHIAAQLDRKGAGNQSSIYYILRRLGPKAKHAAAKLEATAKKGLNRLPQLVTILAIDPSRGPVLRAEVEALVKAPGKREQDIIDASVLLYRIDKKTAHLEPVHKLLRGDDPHMAGVAARRVGDMGAEGAMFLADLQPLLKNPDPRANLNACWGIWGIEQKADKVVPVLSMALTSKSTEPMQACTLLQKMGPAGKDASEALVKAIKAETNPIRREVLQRTLVAVDRPTGLRMMKSWD